MKKGNYQGDLSKLTFVENQLLDIENQLIQKEKFA